MKITNGKIIAKITSKKGSEIASVYRDVTHLVDNCVLVNPLKVEIKVNSLVDGDMIINRDGLNTFIITDIRKE